MSEKIGSSEKTNEEILDEYSDVTCDTVVFKDEINPKFHLNYESRESFKISFSQDMDSTAKSILKIETKKGTIAFTGISFMQVSDKMYKIVDDYNKRKNKYSRGTIMPGKDNDWLVPYLEAVFLSEGFKRKRRIWEANADISSKEIRKKIINVF